MTTVQSYGVGLGSRDYVSESSTPKAPMTLFENTQRPAPPVSKEDTSTTPTMASFPPPTTGKRALPSSSPTDESFSGQAQTLRSTPKRDGTGRSETSSQTQDMEMAEDSEGEEEASDNESIDEETGRPSKKKKGQRFFCTDYPPCTLSFTRSEHLARHIRKHTGERPFQCHCSRKFSRLDNLRQHAQTVHLNEEIPGDSLAATGTRFQRQIRTERVPRVQGGSRSRAGSGASHRGHSRNLSTSSVASNASSISTISSMSIDERRRPHSLMMAPSPSNRAGLSIDVMRASPQAGYSFAGPSQTRLTPTSSTFSGAPGSPHGSAHASPLGSRNVGYWGDKTPGRRLSVPSGQSPFLNETSTGQAYFQPYPSSSHNSSNNSLLASPTSSNYSFSRQDSGPEHPDWRRRTWHPSTYGAYPRPATSGLSYHQTPDEPRPAFAPQAFAAAGNSTRLPGIEAFDQMTQRPRTPPRPLHSPLLSGSSHRPPLFQNTSSSHHGISGMERRGHASVDLTIRNELTRLDIASGTPPRDAGTGAWAQQVAADIHNAAAQSAQAVQSSYTQPPQGQQTQFQTLPLPMIPQERVQHGMEQESKPFFGLDRSRRRGWYNGPLPTMKQALTGQRTSPTDSSSSDGAPTPSTTSAEYQPSIVHANGYVEPARPLPVGQPVQINASTNYAPAPQTHSHHEQSRQVTLPKPEMSGLDALVAVATSEEKLDTGNRT